MAVFLVDFEFREKARALLTRREIYFAIFLAIFAMLSWSEVVNFLQSGGILPRLTDPYEAMGGAGSGGVNDGLSMDGGNPDDPAICNPHNRKNCVVDD